LICFDIFLYVQTRTVKKQQPKPIQKPKRKRKDEIFGLDFCSDLIKEELKRVKKPKASSSSTATVCIYVQRFLTPKRVVCENIGTFCF